VNAWWDWYLNLAKEPPKQLQIMQDALAKMLDNWTFGLRRPRTADAPAEGDNRFGGQAWTQCPSMFTRTITAIMSLVAANLLTGAGVAPRMNAPWIRGPQCSRGHFPGQLFCHNPNCSRPLVPNPEKFGARLQQLARGRRAHPRGKGANGTENFVAAATLPQHLAKS